MVLGTADSRRSESAAGGEVGDGVGERVTAGVGEGVTTRDGVASSLSKNTIGLVVVLVCSSSRTPNALTCGPAVVVVS